MGLNVLIASTFFSRHTRGTRWRPASANRISWSICLHTSAAEASGPVSAGGGGGGARFLPLAGFASPGPPERARASRATATVTGARISPAAAVPNAGLARTFRVDKAAWSAASASIVPGSSSETSISARDTAPSTLLFSSAPFFFLLEKRERSGASHGPPI